MHKFTMTPNCLADLELDGQCHHHVKHSTDRGRRTGKANPPSSQTLMSSQGKGRKKMMGAYFANYFVP